MEKPAIETNLILPKHFAPLIEIISLLICGSEIEDDAVFDHAFDQNRDKEKPVLITAVFDHAFDQNRDKEKPVLNTQFIKQHQEFFTTIIDGDINPKAMNNIVRFLCRNSNNMTRFFVNLAIDFLEKSPRRTVNITAFMEIISTMILIDDSLQPTRIDTIMQKLFNCIRSISMNTEASQQIYKQMIKMVKLNKISKDWVLQRKSEAADIASQIGLHLK
ncbi:hypothetical protein M0811_05010 [Anaeramoeba ignava]|uniref:DUF3517 domain-containing protein n=1 Tax=Anaeramoeba ignava TaxID=1746090 RepID=A0A9Q0RFH8_ANAIG|nr:hypothetical protein M0811_05010 [Anaeramoeba ignava]